MSWNKQTKRHSNARKYGRAGGRYATPKKRYRSSKMNYGRDSDGDGVPDKYDCKPRDPSKDSNFLERIKDLKSKAESKIHERQLEIAKREEEAYVRDINRLREREAEARKLRALREEKKRLLQQIKDDKSDLEADKKKRREKFEVIKKKVVSFAKQKGKDVKEFIFP